MGIITYEMEVASSISPAKMFKAFVLDADNLIPKVLPQAIKSVETLEGDGGPGTIKITTFGEGSQFKSVKHRVDELDTENLRYKYSIIEGDVLMGVVESISYEVRIDGDGDADGGSICKTKSTYYTKENIQITEQQIKSGKEKALVMFRAVEAYLSANPHLYA